MTQNRRRILQILNAFYFFRIYIFSKFDVIFCFSNVKKLADQKIVGFTATQSFYTKRATNWRWFGKCIKNSLKAKELQETRINVQFLSIAPSQYNPNQILVTSEWFGFTLYLGDLTWFYHKIGLATKTASPLPFLCILKVALHIPNFHNLFVGITSSFSVVFPSVTKNPEKRAQTFCLRPPFDCHPLSAYTILPRFAATRQFQIIPLSFASFSASVPLIFEVTSFNRIFSFIESFMLEIGCLSSA